MKSAVFMLGVATLSIACGGRSLTVVDASSPPHDVEAAPAAEKSKICVIRPSNADGGSVHAIRDNGALVGATGGGSHFCYLAEPGDHKIVVDGAEQITLTAKGGRLYYLQEDVAEVMGNVVMKLAWVEQGDAKPMLSSTRYVVIGTTPADETVVPVAPRR